MKILILAALMAAAVPAFAQPSGRVDTRKLAGVVNFVQDEFERANKPVWVLNSLAYNVTNADEGLIFVRTNATVLVVIGLPNPTNNINRGFRVSTLGASTAILTNTTYAGSFTDMFTMTNAASGYFIASNKTATVYSTGTNYLVRLN